MKLVTEMGGTGHTDAQGTQTSPKPPRKLPDGHFVGAERDPPAKKGATLHQE